MALAPFLLFTGELFRFGKDGTVRSAALECVPAFGEHKVGVAGRMPVLAAQVAQVEITAGRSVCAEADLGKG